jgi:hypothetical protein
LQIADCEEKQMVWTPRRGIRGARRTVPTVLTWIHSSRIFLEDD